MDAELASLEDKIRQTAELCQQLRAENTELRQRVFALERDRKRLSDKIDGATERLEALLGQIPE